MNNEKIKAVMNEVAAEAAERDELIQCIAVALLAKKNLFILGDTGQAKSYCINAFRKRITDAKQFERLMSKQTDEEQLFGRLDLSSIIPGHMPHNELIKDSTYAIKLNEVKKTYMRYAIDGKQETLEQVKKHIEILNNIKEIICSMPRMENMAKALSGGDGNMNTMENMAEQCADLHKQLIKEMQQASPSEKKAINLANRLKSKREQYAYLQKQADRSANVNNRKLYMIITAALTQAMDSAETIRFILTSWGNGDMSMPKNEFNSELLERVSKSEKLAYVAKFLGRYRDIYSDKKKNGYEFGCGEVYDITSGNSISRALTSELSLLSDPKTIPVFIRKYQNKQLKQYRRREAISKGKGDIIVCLDESYSTYGDNQAWGMAMAMILLQICHENKRNFALIHFSDKIKTHIFPADDTYMRERMFEASETFLGGNTDFEMPLNKAMDLIQDGDWKDADIVFITDGNCNISKEFENKFKEMQSSHKFTVTGILLDKGKNDEFSLKKFCKKIYRTSEMCKDDIAFDIMKDRR